MQAWRSPHDSEAGSSLRTKRNALSLALIFAFLALVIQGAGAVFTGSLALLGDTAHVFTDFFSLGMSLVAVILAARPISSGRSFGLFRLEVLASFLNGILLLFVALGIAWEAVERFQAPRAVPAIPLLIVAGVGLALNLLSALVLMRTLKEEAHHHHHDHSHEHSHHTHDHSHHSDRNIRSAMLHVLSDALGSVAVMVGAIVMHFTDIAWVDPAVGLLLSGVILFWSLRVVRDSGHVLLEGTPKHIDITKMEKTLLEFDPRIKKIADLHVWEITSRMYTLSVELYIQETSLVAVNEVRNRLEKLLHDQFGVAHTAIVFKPAS